MNLMERLFLPKNPFSNNTKSEDVKTALYRNKIILRILVLIAFFNLITILIGSVLKEYIWMEVYRTAFLGVIILVNYSVLYRYDYQDRTSQKILMYSTFTAYFLSALVFFVYDQSLASILDIMIGLSLLGIYQSRNLMLRVGMPALFIATGFLMNNFHTIEVYGSVMTLVHYICSLLLFFMISYVASLNWKLLYNYLNLRVNEASTLSDKYENLLHAVASSLERIAMNHDNDSKQHIKRISKYSVSLARVIGLSAKEVDEIALGAPLHDFGKVVVPQEILNKPGQLTDEEFSIVKTHSTEGYMMISGMQLGEKIENIILHHHEKWDGSGYPHGLAGREIPLEARIVAIADVYDALRSSRPYKEGWDHDSVREHIIKNSAKHFDPLLVNAFLQCEEQFRHVFDSSIDTPEVVVKH